MRDALTYLVRKRVEIHVRGDITYKGLFIEATEDTIHLKGDTGWITIPMERVVSVREEGSEAEEWRNKDIDPSFFTYK